MTAERLPDPSSTVLVLRDGAEGPEVFMVRRHESAAFMGGAHVFPGGRVDPADYARCYQDQSDGLDHARRQLLDLDPAAALAWHVAAARELFEEAGLLVARRDGGPLVSFAADSVRGRFDRHRRDVHAGTRSFGDVLDEEHVRLALDVLTLCAHWVTPPTGGRRFDTRFFMTRVPPGQSPTHDSDETIQSLWITAAGAISAARRGDIVLPPPTWMMLRELERYSTVDDLVRAVRARPVVRREPALVHANGTRELIMPSHPELVGCGTLPAAIRFVWTDGRWIPRMSETAER